MAISWKEMTEQQPRVMRLLHNSIEKKRLSHAYLFEGKKGTGKLDAALLLAKSFFCLEAGTEPCGECRNCKRIASGNHPDLHVVQPDGLSIKKAQIQSLQEEFSKTGLESHKKTVHYIPCGSNDDKCGKQSAEIFRGAESRHHRNSHY